MSESKELLKWRKWREEQRLHTASRPYKEIEAVVKIKMAYPADYISENEAAIVDHNLSTLFHKFCSTFTSIHVLSAKSADCNEKDKNKLAFYSRLLADSIDGCKLWNVSLSQWGNDDPAIRIQDEDHKNIGLYLVPIDATTAQIRCMCFYESSRINMTTSLDTVYKDVCNLVETHECPPWPG